MAGVFGICSKRTCLLVLISGMDQCFATVLFKNEIPQLLRFVCGL